MRHAPPANQSVFSSSRATRESRSMIGRLNQSVKNRQLSPRNGECGMGIRIHSPFPLPHLLFPLPHLLFPLPHLLFPFPISIRPWLALAPSLYSRLFS